MSFYPQNRRPFQKINFTNPPAAFRGYPFWSWNTRLEKGKLLRQLGFFKDMGMGGATIHCRTGLDTAYMGPEYMDIVRASVDWARKNGMFIWLYDEDRWPSGYGGGLVTVDPRYRARHLLWTCRPYGPGDNHPQEIHASTAGTGRTGNGKLLYIFDVELDAEGCLRSYRPRAAHDRSQPRGRLWYAYLEIAPEQPWFNYQTYVDTLNADAIRRFTATTHEVYKDSLRKDFGKTVPTIFTDEPQFTHKMCFNRADEQRDIVVPFTDDLPQTFREVYGESLESHLPELFWELPKGRASVTRCRYHDHVAERFACAFADTLGRWCRRNGIALTGHMMEEPTLATQTGALGEAMRSYRSFDLPGIDILCDHHPETDGHPIEFTTAKQAQSASRQYGCEGVMSEIYGVTNWDFTFAGHKAQGDWQAALGVTARVHHLSLVTLEGEAKRDFPSSIFYQSPWFREYPLIETHFARINSLMTRGKPVVRVGVIHPVESYWLCFGPKEQTGEERKSRDQQFESLTRWLVHSLVDYDFISESLLPAQCARVTGKTLNVGKMRYECVIVPGMRTIRSTTLDRLEAFARAGGTVVFAGEIPTLVDAVASNRAKALADRASHVEFTDWALSRAIEPFRDLGAYRQDNGLLVEQFAAQCRDEGNARYVFVCNTHRALVMDSSRNAVDTVIRIKGSWRVEEFDTLTGATRRKPARTNEGWTEVAHAFDPMGSLLLRLVKIRAGKVSAKPLPSTRHGAVEVARLNDPFPVTLAEPNCLLLDQPQWRIDNGPWQPQEEILRLDNLVRREFGLGAKDFAIAQPWSDREPSPVLGHVTLRYEIVSETDVAAPLLALEKRAAAQIAFNGRQVANRKAGWWVDEKIETVRLPRMKKGRSILTITYPYHRRLDLEAVYILGDFGVRVSGRHAVVTAPVRELAFGDWTRQGLPFYTGNVTCHCQAPPIKEAGKYAVDIPHFKAPLISAEWNGRLLGKIAFPPYRVALPELAFGKKADRLDLTVFGHRYNALGNLHCTSLHHWNVLGAPCGWRTVGEDFSYEYQLRPMGILTAPIIKKWS